jgi:hypothetical protein
MKKNITVLFVLISVFVMAQQTPFSYKIDKKQIKLGEEIILTLETKADTLAKVVFPEAQNFGALEVIESYKIDTTINGFQRHLIKKYGISYYDSAQVVLPKIPVYINNKPFFTDSLLIDVLPVAVDTLKQQMHDIKDVLQPDAYKSFFWYWFVGILLGLILLGFLIYYFIKKRNSKQVEEETFKSPFEKARFLLKKLDYKDLRDQEEVKLFYSDLTHILRDYIEETLTVPAKESTTSELIQLLKKVSKDRKLPFGQLTLKDLETVLKEADLVKFAKSKPLEFELEEHKSKIEKTILNIQKSLPEVEEVSEEELNEQLKLEIEQKRKRKRTIWTIVISCLAIVITTIILLFTVGQTWLRDNYIGHTTKSLLNVEWVTSTYGYPGITVETPKVLSRLELDKQLQLPGMHEMSVFQYGSLFENFYIVVGSTTYNQEVELNLEGAVEGQLKMMEQFGLQNMLLKTDDYQMQGGMEGKRTHGSVDYIDAISKIKTKLYFQSLVFKQNQAIQNATFIHAVNDENAKLIVDRIIKSIELQNISQQ